MTRKLRRNKSKLHEHLTVARDQERVRGKGRKKKSWEEDAHQDSHYPRILTWTGPQTITTDASSEIRMPRGGEIVQVHMNVQGAPSGSSFLCDIKIEGTSIFASDLAEIVAGAKSSFYDTSGNLDTESGRAAADPNLCTFRTGDAITIVPNTISSATGPLIVQLEIDWED